MFTPQTIVLKEDAVIWSLYRDPKFNTKKNFLTVFDYQKHTVVIISNEEIVEVMMKMMKSRNTKFHLTFVSDWYSGKTACEAIDESVFSLAKHYDHGSHSILKDFRNHWKSRANNYDNYDTMKAVACR